MKLLAVYTYVCKYVDSALEMFEHDILCSNIEDVNVKCIINTYKKALKTSETILYFANNAVKKTRFEYNVDNIHIIVDFTEFKHDFNNVVTFTVTKE